MCSGAVGTEAEGEEEADELLVCANCGIAEVDDIKLKGCDDGCDLVKYCGDTCKQQHREQHSEDCKKRRTELHDKKLFTQPDGSHLGECPICFLPLPLDPTQSMMYSCCCKLMCNGCTHVHHRKNGNTTCPFCREPVESSEESDKRLMKRVEANDPVATCVRGLGCYRAGDYDKALKYLTKAAELGNADAQYKLGCMYSKGEGVEMDAEKTVYHYEKAAIGGHYIARHNLAVLEDVIGNVERAVKHFIIAATLGHDVSMKKLWVYYSAGNITKKDLDATLRSQQSAIDATKSIQREEAEAFDRSRER